MTLHKKVQVILKTSWLSWTDDVNSTFLYQKHELYSLCFYVAGLHAAFAYGMTVKNYT